MPGVMTMAGRMVREWLDSWSARAIAATATRFGDVLVMFTSDTTGASRSRLVPSAHCQCGFPSYVASQINAAW